jgi:23S rRNA pseudouridine2605 synthase
VVAIMETPKQLIKPERLNKYLAHAGYGSRRQVEDLILAGRVHLDGEPVRELGVRVEPGQKVTVDGEAVRAEKLVYYLVNKPTGYLCTNFDPSRRPLVVDLVPQISQRVYTVGRLDEASEGLVLLTNDGDLAHRLMHPRFGVEKTYLVQVAGFPTGADLKQLTEGVWLSVGKVKAKRVRRLKTQGHSTWLRIVLNEGKNREIRRMLAKFKHKVMTLRREALGPIELGAVPLGKSRRLKPAELETLKHIAYREELARESSTKPRKPKRP